jgi:Phosphopantetheine attachment site
VTGPGRPAGGVWVWPRTAAEELVAAVWADVLGRPQVGALDDFFDIGGHSLLALRAIARLSAAAQVDFTIQAFFADSTVAGVAAELERILLAELGGVGPGGSGQPDPGAGP